MFCQILPLYERGVKRPQRVLDAFQRVYGDLHIGVNQWAPLGRPSLSAYLHRSSPYQPDKLPPLFEVYLEGMASLAFVIEGVELVEGCFYQQAWHCKEPEHKIQVPWTLCSRSSLDELI